MKKLLLASVLCLNSAFAAHMAVTKNKVEFVAKGFPSFIKITGTSESMTGKLEEKEGMLSGKFTLPVKTLKTGMDLRDDHMINKYLHVGKHPDIKLEIKPFKVMPSGKAKGVLMLHGEEKPVEVSYTSKRSGKELSVDANFKIDIVDFKIDIPSFQGITVAKEVKLKAMLTAITEMKKEKKAKVTKTAKAAKPAKKAKK